YVAAFGKLDRSVGAFSGLHLSSVDRITYGFRRLVDARCFSLACLLRQILSSLPRLTRLPHAASMGEYEGLAMRHRIFHSQPASGLSDLLIHSRLIVLEESKKETQSTKAVVRHVHVVCGCARQRFFYFGKPAKNEVGSGDARVRINLTGIEPERNFSFF